MNPFQYLQELYKIHQGEGVETAFGDRQSVISSSRPSYADLFSKINAILLTGCAGFIGYKGIEMLVDGDLFGVLPSAVGLAATVKGFAAISDQVARYKHTRM